jgi:hypothetical protein
MTPKEKAQKLIASFSLAVLSETGHELNMTKVNGIARASALMAVDEILNVVWYVPVDIEYWQEVKKEI